ncbi:hypothetical protein [[Acholeplasma] multilocale]|uniref:hypothetical protein n=1 Tax=[Acholeplasma] multilocale TaxID=264638 RepID=UPI000554E907|nr:hypothetical protein [[Acholeplasma] multilocale]
MKINKRKLTFSLIGAGMAISPILGLGLTAPGMGLESLKFINSIEKQINEKIPKNKFVLDGTNPLFKFVVNSAIKTSYVADVLSITDWSNPDKVSHIAEYKEFAEARFEQRWGHNRDNGIDIDLNDVSLDLINLDHDFGEKYSNPGYTKAGISWIFEKNTISQLLNPNLKDSSLYTDALKKQTIIDQDLYNSFIDVQGPGLEGIKVTNSMGVNIVNSKVWFMNMQRSNIKFAMTPGLGIFKNKDLNENDLPDYVTADDFYHPNFTQGIEITIAGVVFLLVITPITTIAGIGAIIMLKKKGKVTE